MALSLVALLGTANANPITSVDVTPNTGYPRHQQTITVHINDTSTHCHVLFHALERDPTIKYDPNYYPEEDDVHYYQSSTFGGGLVQNGVCTTTWLCPEPNHFYRNRFDVYYFDDTGTQYYFPVVLYIVPAKNVPEFPSVVVPVATILGLVMIFGRKKE
jgi:hypothetical protein